MHVLLLAGANTQLIDVHGGLGTAPQWAEVQGQPTTAACCWMSPAVVGWP